MSIRKINHRQWLRSAFTLLAVALCLPVLADGEQRYHEASTKWVDPVEFYHLQDINRTDLQRDYDQGDIDFNKVLKEKGVKVYGLRLKPIAGAGHVEKFAQYFTNYYDVVSFLGMDQISYNIDYQDLYGIRGVPMNEAAFCIYADETVNRQYEIVYHCTYQRTSTSYQKNESFDSKCEINFQNLRIAPIDQGIGVSYSMGGRWRFRFEGWEEWSGSNPNAVHDDALHFNKPDGVDHIFSRFIYFKGDRNLLLMLGADGKAFTHWTAKSTMKPLPADRQAMSDRPWPRVYFIVEQILVEDKTSGMPLPALSEEDRQELTSTLENLMLWLKGEGDPLGLGEHTGPVEAAVINAISTIAAILLGSGIAGMVSGSGAQMVAGLTSSIVETGLGATPPPMPSSPPDIPQQDGLKPKRPEEEEETPPPPPDPNAFNPGDYPYGNQFLSQRPDGDIVMKSPVTGKDVHYYSNGDGTWFSDSGMTYNKSDIAERLRYEAENAGVLKLDAETAARNVAEQRAQWDAQNQRDLERGYTDAMQEYRNEKAELERAEKKQEELQRLAEKYHVAATEKAVKEAIKWEIIMNEIDARTYNAEAEEWGKKEEYLKKVDKVAEIGVNVLSTVTPGGSHIKNAYTFAKSTLVGVSEAVAEGKSGFEAVRHVSVRMGEGALGVIQNEAGNLSGGWKGEYGITVGTEFLKSTMKEYNDSGGDWDKALKAGLSGIGSSTLSFGIGKGISAGFTTLKEGSKDYMEYAKKGLVPEGDAGYKVMSRLNKFLNGETTLKGELKIGKQMTSHNYDWKAGDAKDAKEVFSFAKWKNVKDAANVSLTKVGETKAFAVSINETISRGDLSEAVVNEALSQVKYGEGDDKKNIFELMGGQYMEDVYDFGKEMAKLPRTAAKYAAQRNR